MTCRKNLQFLIYESRQLLCSMVIGLIECRNRICGATHLVTRFEKRNVREGYLWNLRTLLTDLPPSLGRISGSNLLMSLKKSRSGRGHTSAYTVAFAGRVVVGGVIPHAAKMAICLASGRARCNTSCPPISWR